MRYGRVTIAIVLLLVLLAMMVTGTLLTRAEPLDTYHSGWHLVRETASEDGATLAAVYDLTGVGTTAGNFASKDTTAYTTANGGAFRIPTTGSGRRAEGYSPGSKWVFAISGENFNNIDDTFSYTLLGWSKTNGMAQVICDGTGTLGTQAVVLYPDDSGDAMGRTASVTGVTYTHATTTLTDTDDIGSFDGAVVGMLARVTGTNLTDEIVQITTVTDANIIICSGITSANNNTDSTVEFNPAFWADTLTITDQSKWGTTITDPNNVTGYNEMPGTIGLINSGNNNVANLIVELRGIEFVQFVIYDADAATGEQAGNITVYGRRH